MRGSAAVATTFAAALAAVACSGRTFDSGRDTAGDASLSASKQAGGSSSASSGGTVASSGSAAASTGGALAGTGGAAPAGTAGAAAGSSGSGGSRGGAGGSSSSSGGSTGGGGTGGIVAHGGSGGSVSVDSGVPGSCNSASDCPKPGTVCQTAACLGHQCGFVAAPSAIPPENTLGDCRKIICSQSGTETVLTDPSDVSDGNECTVDSCQGAVASHTPSTGARCLNGTKYCNSVGNCVDCIEDAQCPGGTTECAKASCVQGTCRLPAAGVLCNGGKDQCDGQGSCLDCWDNGGCDGCCFCLSNICVQG